MIFYVYFDNESRNILSVTNEKNNSKNTFVEKSIEDVKDFINGEKNFTDYKFDTNFNFVCKTESTKDVVSNTFVEIIKQNEYELKISHNDNWFFKFADDVKNINGNLFFGITQKSNPNLLIRTISFASQLAYEGHGVDFKYDSEKELSNLSVWAIHPPFKTASLEK